MHRPHPGGRAGLRHFYIGFARVHSRLLRSTRGRPSRLTPRLRCLVLETIGRRSHRRRQTVLLYMPTGGGFVVLASNFGREHPPAWWLNLEATPEAAVLLAGRRVEVRARELQGEERAAALREAVAYNRQWRGYARTLHRHLPVVRLEQRSP
ncbi:MAG: nitroreductase family deazaflavin-dependent oxidoreductase [Acidobacteriota bacterium]|nr:nitroreductase family deazaflavin-dependent oxidoreductase [Acidobacteriota bacterium]